MQEPLSRVKNVNFSNMLVKHANLNYVYELNITLNGLLCMNLYGRKINI